jgi:antirestriction protein ArdC
MNHGSHCGPSAPGSRLDADHPEKGVLIPRRFTRLNRDLKSRFNEKSYAAEELVAELSAAFLCAHLNIKGELRHADYIGHWIALLKDDPRAIFTAASKASQAADYLRAFSEKVEDEHAEG